jgi:hypothetical protein
MHPELSTERVFVTIRLLTHALHALVLRPLSANLIRLSMSHHS